MIRRNSFPGEEDLLQRSSSYRLAIKLLTALACAFPVSAHDLITTKITWTREISRLVLAKCVSCHQEGGQAFSLANYADARPWAKAIQEEVLERRMPPYGAVKGFGDIEDDQSLTQEQIALFSAWAEGGAPEGDTALLPKSPSPVPVSGNAALRSTEWIVEGNRVLQQPATFVGIKPKSLRGESSIRVIAQTPDGTVTPLLWLYQCNPKFFRSYLFRRPLTFPTGTKILAVPKASATIALLTALPTNSEAATSSPKRNSVQ